MNWVTTGKTNMADKLKFVLALLLVAAGVAGFYILAEQPMVLRVIAVLVGMLAGAGAAWFTEPGQRFVVLAQESVVEAKKVVWPSRKETLQTTGIVFAFVLVMAIMLWLTDKSLEWVLYDLVLGWKKS
jgi:preprotein translocase subunit SecE